MADSLPQHGVDPGSFEALSQQISLNSACGCVVERRGAAETLLQRSNQQLVLVHVGKDLRDGLLRDSPGDTKRVHLPQHAEPAMSLHVRFGSGARARRAQVVESAFLAQALHRGVNVTVVEFTPLEARPQLRFAQLTSGEQAQAGEIGVGQRPIVPVGEPARARTLGVVPR